MLPFSHTKEEVDYQFWYPQRNKVIKEYKNIRDNYSWDDDFDFEDDCEITNLSFDCKLRVYS